MNRTICNTLICSLSPTNGSASVEVPDVTHPSPTERRFASRFLVDTSAAGVQAMRAQMGPDGRMTSWIWVAAIDLRTMLRLGILIADQLAGGVTDVVLELGDVVVVEKRGVDTLARIASQLREVRVHRADPASRGTLAVQGASPDVLARLEPLIACGMVAVRDEAAFPALPHSLEGFAP
jgi:hypothetical protein